MVDADGRLRQYRAEPDGRLVSRVDDGGFASALGRVWYPLQELAARHLDLRRFFHETLGQPGTFSDRLRAELRRQGRSLELAWPEHPVFPSYGYVVRRRDLDWMVALNAEAAGATLLQGADAIAPVIDRGFVRGAVVQTADAPSPVELRARYVVVADGSLSRFGRSLGAVTYAYRLGSGEWGDNSVPAITDGMPGPDGQIEGSRRYANGATVAQECARSRVWAGVHFPAANEEGRRLGTIIAARAAAAVPPLR